MSGSELTPVAIGQVLAGKYRVDRVLGAGGMGVVVAATHLALDQRVALKFLLPHALGNREAVGRFVREARTAVRLKSENVARVLDVGTLETGEPYIVMEYLEGHDLVAALRQSGALPIPIVVEYLLQACDAIAEAHALGMVHRDLKPANIFLTKGSDGRALLKVLDFGVAKSTMGQDLGLTQTAMVMGSPAYMSPEQMRSSKNVDARADIWSLGVILYQLVSGRMPFAADTFTELCLKVAMDPVPALPPMPGGTPPGFEMVVRRCLEKDPTARYQDMAEVALALAPFGPPSSRERADRVAHVLGKSGGGTMMAMTAPPLAVPATGTPPPVAKARPRWPIVAGLVVLAGVGAAVAVAATGSSAAPAPAAAVPPPAPASTVVAAPPVAPAAAPAPVPVAAAPAPVPVAAVAPPEAPPASPDAGVPATPAPAKVARPARPVTPRPPEPEPRPSPAATPPKSKPIDPYATPD